MRLAFAGATAGFFMFLIFNPSIAREESVGHEFIFGEDGTYERWDWLTAMARSFELKEGKHALVIKNREDESKFDQILFIADKDYVPQGIEEK